MNETVLLTSGAVLVCVALGWILGLVLIPRTRTRPKPGDGSADVTGIDGRLSDALSFVGVAFGILLGLLLVFAVQHFSDARSTTQQEAASAIGLFRAAGPYEPDERAKLRQDLICAMDSIAKDDFAASGDLDLDGSINTDAWLARLQHDIENVTIRTPAQSQNQYFITQELLDLNKMREIRLIDATPQIPEIIWAVIYICTIAFVMLLVLNLADNRRLAAICVVACTAVLLSVVVTMSVLDYPFTGKLGVVEPKAMTGALASIQLAFPDTDWSTCERLQAVDPAVS